jgi:hypothetical protein
MRHFDCKAMVASLATELANGYFPNTNKRAATTVNYKASV